MEDQSTLILQALQAPLADSRAAAVNIRLISCIGRQAKIGFCLQTRNSFNLLCWAAGRGGAARRGWGSPSGMGAGTCVLL